MIVSTRKELAKAIIDNIGEMEITGEAYWTFKHEQRYSSFFYACLIAACVTCMLALLLMKNVFMLKVVAVSGVLLFGIPAAFLGRIRWETGDATVRVLSRGCQHYRIAHDSANSATIVLKKSR